MSNQSVIHGPLGVIGVHFRVVAALLVREMSTRFGSNPGGYIWALVDPVANIAILSALFGAIARAPALGTSFPLFFATGFLCFQYYQATVTYVNFAVRANKALLNYPNVAPIDTVMARYILQFGTTTMVSVVVLGVVLMTMRAPPSLHWPPIFEAIVLASLLGLGNGLLNNAMFTRFPIYEKLFTIINRPLYFMSGVFFLADAIPHPYREVVMMNPLVHVIMLFRQGFYPEYRAAAIDLGYLYGWVGILMFFGTVAFVMNSATMRND
jgi:capsular polysaccharide transport system permease protein